MKIAAYVILSLLLIAAIGYCALIAAFQGTTWGGWRPEAPEFNLSAKEQHWQQTTEEKYDILFQDIHLDESYMEDSIIHMEIWVNDRSALQQELCNSEIPVKTISKAYSQIIAQDRPQKFLELSFENLWLKNNHKRLKYTTVKTYLYNATENALIEQPDNEQTRIYTSQ